MPFLPSGSFDGVFSHYVLDYVSPICARQVLREAHRVLAPGGLLVIYLAGMGLGGGDESRTVSYSPTAMRRLLAEAGFDEVEAEASPNGRNTVARARHLGSPRNGIAPSVAPSARIDGDTQLSASFPRARGPRELELELAGTGHRAAVSVKLPGSEQDDSAISVCVRAQLGPGSTELQLCAWRGFSPIVAEAVRVEFAATEMQILSEAEVGHVDRWVPSSVGLEPAGSAYARFDDLTPGAGLSEAERGAEGRQVVVESVNGPAIESRDELGPGRNRFLVRRASRLDLPALDRDWLAARLHGVAVSAAELDGEGWRELLLWSGWRQSMVYLEGEDWESIRGVAERRGEELRGPLVLVDPALSSFVPARGLPADVVSFAAGRDAVLVLLGEESLALSDQREVARASAFLLLSFQGAPRARVEEQADEVLRYLTERTLLMRLRQTSGCSWAEVGRRPRVP